MNVRRALEEVPVDRDAEERAWAVVRAAYGSRERAPRTRRPRRAPAVAVAVAAVVAAALSPPGRSVVDSVRRTIGVEHAAPALFRLPAPGRLLVSGEGGSWIVASDGSKRRLGDWREASWSPHGFFVVAALRNQLVALEPGDGTVRWALARPGVRFPRWGGTRIDTRVAFLSDGRLHVLAGDGTGDRVVARAAPVAPAWRPESHVVAYATRSGGVAVYDVDARKTLAVHAARGARTLAWSPDGTQLAAVTPGGVHVWGDGAHIVMRLRGVRDVAFARDGRLALLHGRELRVVGKPTVFRAPAALSGLAWSPNGRWLVAGLPSAGQLVFVGRGRVVAVSNVPRQFGGSVALDGWVSAP